MVWIPRLDGRVFHVQVSSKGRIFWEGSRVSQMEVWFYENGCFMCRRIDFTDKTLGIRNRSAGFTNRYPELSGWWLGFTVRRQGFMGRLLGFTDN